MGSLLSHVVDEGIDLNRFWENEHVAHVRANRRLRQIDPPDPSEQIDDVDDSNDVVDGAFVNGKLPVVGPCSQTEHGRDGGIRRHGDRLRSRHHDFVGAKLGEVEDPAEHILFAFLEDARLPARGDQKLELVHGIHQSGLALRRQPEKSQSRGASSRQKPDEGMEKRLKDQHRFDNNEANLLGSLECQILRDELA